MSPIRSACIVGSGVAALLCAVALARRMPALKVSLLDPGLPTTADALLAAARPSIRVLHDAVGLDEQLVFSRTDSAFFLGTETCDRSTGAWFRGFDDPGRSHAGVAFHQLWNRARLDRTCDLAYDAFSPAAALARTGRFAEPSDQPASAFANLDYGLLLDVDGYRAGLRTLADGIGVSHLAGAIARIEADTETTRIVAIDLLDQRRLEADLWIDATGPGALVRRSLPSRFVDWSDSLRTDRLLIGHAPSRQLLSGRINVTTLPMGYVCETGTRTRRTSILAYQAATTTPAQAERAISMTGVDLDAALPLVQGALADTWRGNCVAIGEAAVAIEPLAQSGMNILCRQINRIIAHWTDDTYGQSETEFHNRRALLDAERSRDFVHAHHLLGLRSGAAWLEDRAPDMSAALHKDLTLFRTCGRLTLHDENPHDPSEWMTALIGLGHLPLRVDALTAELSTEAVASAVRVEQWRLAEAVGAAASHIEWLRIASTTMGNRTPA